MADLKQLMSDQCVCCHIVRNNYPLKRSQDTKDCILKNDEERHTWFTNQDEEEFDLPEHFWMMTKASGSVRTVLNQTTFRIPTMQIFRGCAAAQAAPILFSFPLPVCYARPIYI